MAIPFICFFFSIFEYNGRLPSGISISLTPWPLHAKFMAENQCGTSNTYGNWTAHYQSQAFSKPFLWLTPLIQFHPQIHLIRLSHTFHIFLLLTTKNNFLYVSTLLYSVTVLCEHSIVWALYLSTLYVSILYVTIVCKHSVCNLSMWALYVWAFYVRPLYVSTLCVATLYKGAICEHSMDEHSMYELSICDHSMGALYMSSLCITTITEHYMCDHCIWAHYMSALYVY